MAAEDDAFDMDEDDDEESSFDKAWNSLDILLESQSQAGGYDVYEESEIDVDLRSEEERTPEMESENEASLRSDDERTPERESENEANLRSGSLSPERESDLRSDASTIVSSSCSNPEEMPDDPENDKMELSEGEGEPESVAGSSSTTLLESEFPSVIPPTPTTSDTVAGSSSSTALLESPPVIPSTLTISDAQETKPKESKSPDNSTLEKVTPQSLPTTATDDPQVTKFHELLKTVPYLTIPLHFGFSRSVKSTAADPQETETVLYMCEHHHVPLHCIEEVHAYLSERNIPLPISCFTFEPCVRPCKQFSKRCWRKMTVKDDLSNGLEIRPIPVISNKAPHTPEGLVNYVKDCFASKTIKSLRVENDDGFLLCCDCPNDCRDKMNCPCFLRTLENCSDRTREKVGDTKIGYQYKRLYKQYMSGIFECNRTCKCRKETCFNRVVQNGLVWQLQLFMTRKKGWGVRTLTDIPKGAFICIYAGEVVDEEYAQKVSSDWNEGKWKYLSELEVGERRKEGYESEVVEPKKRKKGESSGEDLELEELEESGGGEEVPGGGEERLNEEEWEKFLEEEENSGRPPSPTTSCIVSACTFLSDPKENREEPQSQPSTSGTSQHRKKKQARIVPPSSRALRSSDFTESPQNFEILETGRVGLRKMSGSREDLELLCKLNLQSEEASEVCLAPGKWPGKWPDRRKKITRHIFHDDFDQMRNEDLFYEDLERRREEERKNKAKKADLLFQSSRLTTQHIINNVLKSVKPENSADPEGSAPWPQVVHKIRQRNYQQRRTMKTKAFDTKRLQKMLYPSNLCLNFGRSPQKRRQPTKRRRRRKKLTFTPGKRRPTRSSVHPLLRFGFNIDGYKSGNIGRYMNHSCDGNLFPQYVYVNNYDLRFPEIAFFAMRNVCAGEELTWDYHYDRYSDKLSDSEDSDYSQSSTPAVAPRRLVGFQEGGSCRQWTRMRCYCGEDNCCGKIC